MSRPRGLVDASNRPISATEIARVRAKAMLNVPEGPEGAARDPAHWGSPWAYDAQAWRSSDFGDWFPNVRAPDAEINVDRDRVVARTRDLDRNDGWASGALDTIADQAIGANFFPRPSPNWRALVRIDKRLDDVWAMEFGQAVEAEYRLWANGPGRWCDGARSMTIPQLLRLGFVHKMRDGDALAVVLWDDGAVASGAARYATRVQMIDPDRLSNPYEQLDMDRMRGGVEVDLLGAPVAYWLRRAEPNGWFEAMSAMIWDRFERETPWGRPIVVHDFDRRRAGQHRGVPMLMPVIPRFKMLSRYDQVSLQRAVLQAIIGIFVKSPADTEMIRQAVESDGEDLGAYQTMREAYGDAHPAMMGGIHLPKLFPGESIETVKSDNSLSEFEAFEHAVLRSVAAALGTTAEDVSRDYSRVNYSSARAAMLVAWKTLLRRRLDFAAGFASPIYAAWLEEAVDRDYVPMPNGAPDFATWRAAYSECRWIGPGRGWVDPVKERQGEVLGMDAGFSTLESVVAEISGADWRDVLQQRAVEVQEFKRLGLKMPDWAAGGAAALASDDERKPKPE